MKFNDRSIVNLDYPLTHATENVIHHVEIFPPLIILAPANSSQLVVRAWDINGHQINISEHSISFTNSRPDIVNVTNEGFVTFLKEQTNLTETPYIYAFVDNVRSQNAAIIRTFNQSETKDIGYFKLLNGSHINFYVPVNSSFTQLVDLLESTQTIQATDSAYELQRELTGNTPFLGTKIWFISEPYENESMRACGISGNPIRLGYNLYSKQNCIISTPTNQPNWGLIWRELGHNFVISSPEIHKIFDGSDLYIDVLANLAMLYTEEMISKKSSKYNLSSATISSIKGTTHGGLQFNREMFLEAIDNYENNGSKFSTITADVLNGLLIELGDDYEWAIYPRFFSMLNQANEITSQKFDNEKINTLFIALLSSAAEQDLRSVFSELNFPIDDSLFLQIFSKPPSGCELNVETHFGYASGGGTYESGEKASFSVSPTTISGEPGVRQVFIGWTSDSHGGYIGPENPAEVVMSNDITEAAQWKTQYYLTLEDSSGGSTTLSSDWYDAGAEVNIKAMPYSGYSFSSWTGKGKGSYSGSDISHTITMNGPVTETPNFLDIEDPTARAGSDKKVELNSPVILDATGSTDNVGIISYEWDLGDGTLETFPIATHSYEKLETYEVTLTVKDAVGNSDKDTVTITVEEKITETNAQKTRFPTWLLIIIGAAIMVGMVPYLLLRASR